MNIKEKINQIITEKKAALAGKGGGAPAAKYDVGAEAEIIIRDKDGNIKGKHKAISTEITL